MINLFALKKKVHLILIQPVELSPLSLCVVIKSLNMLHNKCEAKNSVRDNMLKAGQKVNNKLK